MHTRVVTRQNKYYNYFMTSEPKAPRFKYSGVVPSVNIKSWSLHIFIGTLPINLCMRRLSPLSGQCLMGILVLVFLPPSEYCVRTWAPPALQN